MSLRYVREDVGPDPVTLSEVKDFMKVIVDDDDYVISMMLTDCIEFAERFTGRQLRANTYSAYDDDLYYEWSINKAPVENLAGVSYISHGNVVVVDSGIYELKQTNVDACVRLVSGQSLPTATVDEIADAVRIQFETRPDQRLPEIKHAIMRHVAYLYENRGDDVVFDRQADFYRRVSLPRV